MVVVHLRLNGLVGGYIYIFSLILGLMLLLVSRLGNETRIYELFSWAGGSPYFKRSSVEFSVEFKVLK